jgi:hypothetical protein
MTSERMTRDRREAFVARASPSRPPATACRDASAFGRREIVSLLVEGGSMQQAFFDADLVVVSNW